MENLHHKPIKQFKLEGSIQDEAAIVRLKVEYIRLLNSEMRLNGYAPRLDIDPDFTIEYIQSSETFRFTLSVYGTYVGKRKAECIQGIDGTQVLMRIVKNKSKESSLGQESTLNQK
jgi:hypothetical protein